MSELDFYFDMAVDFLKDAKHKPNCLHRQNINNDCTCGLNDIIDFRYFQQTKGGPVPAVNFIGTMMANLDNEKLSDKEFREFIRKSLPVVEKPELDGFGNKELAAEIAKYYK